MAVLNGWKEVAGYLSRGVRTVQRWKAYGLPLHYPAGKSRSAVVAVTEELDDWIRTSPIIQHPSELTRLKRRIKELEEEVESLQATLGQHEPRRMQAVRAYKTQT